MKPVLSNDTQPHAVSLESSTTPLRHCDLTSHFVWKLLQLVSNLLHQNRHDVQDKARFSASRSCLSFNRRWSRADHTTNTDSYVPSTTRMLKNSSQYFITAFPYVYGICYHVKKRLVWRPRLSVCLRPTIVRPYSWNAVWGLCVTNVENVWIWCKSAQWDIF